VAGIAVAKSTRFCYSDQWNSCRTTATRANRLPGGGSAFLLANTLSLVVVLFAKPLGGWLSDRIGRRRLMMVLTIVTMMLIYPVM
jgi:nitrate/nitrite transporter NarK